MKKLIVLLFYSYIEVACGTGHSALLDAVIRFQNGYTDTNALQVIYAAARSNDCDAVTTRCMGIYTLHMGMIGDAAVCQGGIGALCSRYPDADVTRLIRELNLMPPPCPTCNGTGSIADKDVLVCYTCNGTGKCLRCDGYGKIAYCPNHHCRTVYTYPKFNIRGNYELALWENESSIHCPACRKNGVKSVLVFQKCTDCSQTGKCPQCRGTGSHGAQAKFTRCPTCGGVPKSINQGAAKNGIIRLCQDTRLTLQKAVDCATAYAAAMGIVNGQARLEALSVCLAKYDGAFNLAMVEEARNGMSKEIGEIEKRRAKEERERLEREQQLAEEKEQMVKSHESLLNALRATVSKRTALIQIRRFIEEKPDSPVIAEAKILATDIEAQVAELNRIAKRNRSILIGCGAIVGLAFVAWLVSCVRFTRPAEYVIPVTGPREAPTQSKIPFNPAASKAPSPLPHLRILLAKQVGTPEADAVACPECGAWLECPPDLGGEDVVCASCQKAFHVE